jgi:hypothetical protein
LHSNLYANWHNHFALIDEYFEYLLGYLNYVGEEMFIIQWIGWRDLSLDMHIGIVKACNKMHAR